MQLPEASVALADLITPAVASTAQYDAVGGGHMPLQGLDNSHNTALREAKKSEACTAVTHKVNTEFRPSVTMPAGMRLLKRKNAVTSCRTQRLPAPMLKSIHDSGTVHTTAVASP